MRFSTLGLAAVIVSSASVGAVAQTKITYGYTAVGDSAPVFVAKEEGYFEKTGLNVDLLRLPNTAVAVPGLMSNSIQVGQLTAPVLLQAISGGIDIVAVSGLSLYSTSVSDGAVVTRLDSEIRSAPDFVGKRIGVAGLHGTSQMLVEKWLKQRGVDSKKVSFVEAAFPMMPDLLKAGTVDAVAVGGPILNRIIGNGLGRVVAAFSGDVASGQILLLTATTRDWAIKNSAALQAFRGAIAEGARFVEQNPEKTRTYVGKYLSLGPELMSQMDLQKPTLKLAASQLQWWVDLLKEQDLLTGEVDSTRAVAAE